MNKYMFSLLMFLATMCVDNLYAKPNAQQTQGTSMNKQLADALVLQVMAEFGSAQSYLEKVSAFEERGLSGFVKYLRAHYFFEIDHGLTFFNYLNKRHVSVSIVPFAVSENKVDTPLAIFEAFLASEIETTKHLNQLSALARSSQDEATILLLQKFADIQVNEEYEVGRIVNRLRFAGDNPAAIFEIDAQLSREVSTIGYIKLHGKVDDAVSRYGYLSEESAGGKGAGLDASSLGGGWRAEQFIG